MIQLAKEQKWIDVDGEKVSQKYIGKDTLKKERVLGKVLIKTLNFQKQAVALKLVIMHEADELFLELSKIANVDLTKHKGNYTLSSFDRSVKLEMNVSSRIEFDENITFAQAKIDEFLKLKTKGADDDLAIIVNSAFQTSNHQLDTKSILKLFSLKITHPIWLEAIALIQKSMQRNKSVRYLAIYQKDAEGKYQQIQLNFSAL